MLEYFLDGIDGGTVAYSYIPYRDASFRGFVKASESDGSLIELSRSGHPNDYNNYACCGKLLNEIRKFASSGNFKDHGFIVWA